MDSRPGCLSGLFKLFLMEKLYGWLQSKTGFGRGGLCGCGCGVVLFIMFVGIACSIFFGTDWFRLGF
jgi:hypothetical protein